MTERTASCNCGKLSITAHGEPVRVSLCHCLACQKRTGSVFGTQARFASSAVTTAGASKVYVRTGDSGVKLSFHFCPDCGATVYYIVADMPDIVAIPVGGFADPAFPQPRRSVYETRMHDWVRLPEGVEHFA